MRKSKRSRPRLQLLWKATFRRPWGGGSRPRINSWRKLRRSAGQRPPRPGKSSRYEKGDGLSVSWRGHSLALLTNESVSLSGSVAAAARRGGRGALRGAPRSSAGRRAKGVRRGAAVDPRPSEARRSGGRGSGTCAGGRGHEQRAAPLSLASRAPTGVRSSLRPILWGQGQVPRPGTAPRLPSFLERYFPVSYKSCLARFSSLLFRVYLL